MKNTFNVDILPKNEKERLEKLYSYELLDTPFEDVFDNIRVGAMR